MARQGQSVENAAQLFKPIPGRHSDSRPYLYMTIEITKNPKDCHIPALHDVKRCLLHVNRSLHTRVTNISWRRFCVGSTPESSSPQQHATPTRPPVKHILKVGAQWSTPQQSELCSHQMLPLQQRSVFQDSAANHQPCLKNRQNRHQLIVSDCACIVVSEQTVNCRRTYSNRSMTLPSTRAIIDVQSPQSKDQVGIQYNACCAT